MSFPTFPSCANPAADRADAVRAAEQSGADAFIRALLQRSGCWNALKLE